MSQQQRRVLPGVGQEQVSLPTGEGFSPSGIIGPWTAGVFYRLYSLIDLVGYNQDLKEENPGRPQTDYLTWARTAKTANGIWYYFKTSEEAARAKDPTESQYGANRVWYFQTRKDQIVNFANPDSLTNWSEFPSWVCELHTPRSKRGYQLHLICLPKAVQAVASYFGLSVPEYDLSELLDRNAVYTDEFFAHMCGDPDEKGSWVESVLGKRRAELWKALGEPDMTKYTRGSGKYGTEAKDLGDCLQIANNAWTDAMWARVVTVPDPRLDATSEDGEKRWKLPVLFEVFPDETTARQVATKEVAEFKARQAATQDTESAPAASAPRPPAPDPPTPTLQVPSKWAEYGTQFWTDWLQKSPSDGGVAGVDAIEAAQLAECDVADINAWRGHLGIL